MRATRHCLIRKNFPFRRVDLNKFINCDTIFLRKFGYCLRRRLNRRSSKLNWLVGRLFEDLRNGHRESARCGKWTCNAGSAKETVFSKIFNQGIRERLRELAQGFWRK